MWLFVFDIAVRSCFTLHICKNVIQYHVYIFCVEVIYRVKRGSLLNKITGLCLSCSLAFSMMNTGVSVSAVEYGVDVSRYQGNINWDAFA